MREPSRRRRCLAARGRWPAAHIPPPRTPRGFAASECRGTPEVEDQKAKRPGSLAGSGPLKIRARRLRQSDAAATRIGAILGLAMLQRMSGCNRRDGARERTAAGEAWGVAKGVPAVHDGVLLAFPYRSAAGRAKVSGRTSCNGSSLFQATGRSVNSLYGLRKRSLSKSCGASPNIASMGALVAGVDPATARRMTGHAQVHARGRAGGHASCVIDFLDELTENFLAC